MAHSQKINKSSPVPYYHNSPIDSDQCQKWDYIFQRTSQHMTLEELDALRTSYDTHGSSAYEVLKSIIDVDYERTHGTQPATKSTDHRGANLLDVLQTHNRGHEVLRQFWSELHAVPAWVDWNQIERGQRFYARYAPAIITFLVFQGFMRGSAVSGVPEVLSRTISFTPRKLLTQFMGNFAWLIKVTNSLQDIKPGGEGHIDSIRARLLHASVRHRILKLVETRPEYYNIVQHGLPINDYNSLNVLSIVCGSLLDALPRLGITPTMQEQEDYVALIRYLAYLNGAPNHRFENYQLSHATMQSFLMAEDEPSEAVKIMANDLIGWVELQPPLYLPRGFLLAGFHQLNGPRYCRTLGFTQPSFYHMACFNGLCTLLQLLSIAQSSVRSFDEFMITFWRTHFLAFVAQRSALIDSLNSSLELMKKVSMPPQVKAIKITKLLTELFLLVVFLTSVSIRPMAVVAFAYFLFNLQIMLSGGGAITET